MDAIDSDKSKDILCVVVSEFVGLDKLKNATENNQKSATQEALLRLSEQQYLPYDFVENKTTGNNEEKIISLKEHSNKNTLETALTSITNKVLVFCSK
jgi:internalin A